jgi:hypothetical protein
MDRQLANFYRNRWQAVEIIEREEQQKSTKDLLDIQGIIESNSDLDQERIKFWVSQFSELLEMPELWDDIAGWLK